MKKVTIRVSKDGSEAKVEVDGVVGSECTDITKGLLEKLGAVEDSGNKDAYYELTNDQSVTQGI